MASHGNLPIVWTGVVVFVFPHRARAVVQSRRREQSPHQRREHHEVQTRNLQGVKRNQERSDIAQVTESVVVRQLDPSTLRILAKELGSCFL